VKLVKICADSLEDTHQINMPQLVHNWQALDDNVNEFAKVVLESHRVPDIIGMSNQC
jgi:hypothetical protein